MAYKQIFLARPRTAQGRGVAIPVTHEGRMGYEPNMAAIADVHPGPPGAISFHEAAHRANLTQTIRLINAAHRSAHEVLMEQMETATEGKTVKFRRNHTDMGRTEDNNEMFTRIEE